MKRALPPLFFAVAACAAILYACTNSPGVGSATPIPDEDAGVEAAAPDDAARDGATADVSADAPTDAMDDADGA